MEAAKNIFSKIQNVINAVIGVILMAIMVIILVQTFTRYVIFYSIPWSEEASRYLFVAMVLLGINMGISQKLMVRIDLIDTFISEKAKYILEIFRQVAALAVSGIFFYSTFGMLSIGGFQMSPAMRIPMNIMYGVICIGFCLSTISVIFQLIETVQNKKGENA